MRQRLAGQPSASRVRSSSTKLRRQGGGRKAPARCSEVTRDVAAGGRPDQVEQVAHRTPVQCPLALHPSTQAIGSVSVACSIAGQVVARRATTSGRRTPPQPVRRVRSRSATTRRGSRGLVDRHALRARRRSGPPNTDTCRSHGTVLPAVASTATPAASPGRTQQPAARQRRRARSRRGPVVRRRRRRRRAERAADDRAASPRCARPAHRWPPRRRRSGWLRNEKSTGTTGRRWPARWRAGRSRRRPGRRWRPARAPCSASRRVVPRRPLEQLGVDRPELDQQQRDRGRAGDDVQPLGEPVAPRRAGRERDRLAGELA